MQMTQAIYITFSIYPQNSGQSIYSLALAKSLCDYVSLHVFSYIHTAKSDPVQFAEGNFASLNFFDYRKDFRAVFDDLAVLNYPVPEMLEAICTCIVKNKVEWVFISHLGMTTFVKPIKKRFPNVKIVYCSENVECLNIRNSLLHSNRTKKMWRLRELLNKKAEMSILKKADAIISISQRDTEYFKNEMGITTPIIQSYPHYSFKCVKQEKDCAELSYSLLIVGTMNWFPNISGTVRFTERVFNKLSQNSPEIDLYIVGKNPTDEIIALGANKKVHITGFVENIDEYYRKCDIAIIPVYEGTGIKIKLVEALGKGIPVISTEFAAKDYMITDEIGVAHSDAEFLEYILKFYEDENYRKTLVEGSKKLYKKICTGNTEYQQLFKSET